MDEDCTDGGVVDVIDGTGAFVARGFFNSQSKILVRVLTRDPNEAIDREFFRRRLTRAWACRQALGFHNACRVVFGDSDGLPGLTVDKFRKWPVFCPWRRSASIWASCSRKGTSPGTWP